MARTCTCTTSRQVHCPLDAGEARPPLTVVLVNNGGGGIFSFLPIAQVSR